MFGLLIIEPRLTNETATIGFRYEDGNALVSVIHSLFAQRRITMSKHFLLALCLGFATGTSANAAPVPPKEPEPIDLVLCLDTSGSMNGLIDSAKLKLWDVVNELKNIEPAPKLRVALYSYGHSNLDSKTGWVNEEIGLTDDLDDVYAKLNKLTTGGGTEYVARVSHAAITDQKWAESKNGLRIVFVCGNEAVDQDPAVSLDTLTKAADKSNVILNTIYCHPVTNPLAQGWQTLALKAGGAFANIDQNQASRDFANTIKTPVDGKLLKLNTELNGTYIAYGKHGVEKFALQEGLDLKATEAAPAAGLARAQSKASTFYQNSSWDLVDKMKNDKTFDITKIKKEELPKELQDLKPKEQVAYIEKKSKERTVINEKITKLYAERMKFVDEARKKQPKTDADKALDEALKSMIRKQAKAKGFQFKDEPK